jgi:ribosomal protein L16 Arg81 hydroxylase
MSNTSRVDVFGDAECHNDYPEFTEKVCPHAVSAILEPGDVLFFPPGWWHAMRSEETSLSVSMWF